MAICQYCKREMLSAPSCSVEVLHRNGKPFRLPRYGEETRYGDFRADDRCHDCGVSPGRFHHLGCDWAECPHCLGQLLSCGCRYDEDPEDLDDENWDDPDERVAQGSLVIPSPN